MVKKKNEDFKIRKLTTSGNFSRSLIIPKKYIDSEDKDIYFKISKEGNKIILERIDL